jgi:hypothetical protein
LWQFLLLFGFFKVIFYFKNGILKERSSSKYFSQNDKKIPPIKSLIGLCLHAGLGDVQPTFRNKVMVKE